MPKYIELDECINCQEEIGATGVHVRYGISHGIDSRSHSFPVNIYNWEHIRTGQGKCDNDSRLYAAGKKRPPQ